MTTEHSFNPGDIEPAKVGLIQEQANVQDEQLDESTPATVSDKPNEQDANLTPVTQPVQALPQESDVYKNLQAAFTRTSQENSELRARLEQMDARLANLSTTQQHAAPAESQANFDDLDKSAGEFEELSPMTEHIKRMQGQIDSQKTAIDNQTATNVKSEQERNQERHEQIIITAHPDAQNIMATIDFQGWLQRQPSYMQGLLQTGSTTQIIDLFTAYKSAAGKQQSPVVELTPEEKQLEAARLAGAPVQKEPAPILTTDSTNQRIYTAKEIDDMDFKTYAALADDIDKAAAEGRVIQ